MYGPLMSLTATDTSSGGAARAIVLCVCPGRKMKWTRFHRTVQVGVMVIFIYLFWGGLICFLIGNKVFASVVKFQGDIFPIYQAAWVVWILCYTFKNACLAMNSLCSSILFSDMLTLIFLNALFNPLPVLLVF